MIAWRPDKPTLPALPPGLGKGRKIRKRFAAAWQRAVDAGLSRADLLDLEGRAMTRARVVRMTVAVNRRADAWLRWFADELADTQRRAGDADQLGEPTSEASR